MTSSSMYALSYAIWVFFCRFSVGYGGSLSVTIDPRQAIAMHTGAMGVGMPVPTAQQVSVVFSENATTTYGEVSGESAFGLACCFREQVALSGHDADIGVGRTSLWWAVYRSLVIGTRPTRCVCSSVIERKR